jgi:hydroxyacylglutathione hydrolase
MTHASLALDSGLTIERFELGPFLTNCYILHTPPNPACVIVDASFGPEVMIDFIREESLDVQAIVLTHAHIDHIAGINELRETFPDAPTMIHDDEANWLTDAKVNMSADYGSPIQSTPADRLLTHDDTLELVGCPWRVLHVPGHSPGSIALYSDDHRVALVGDALFKGSVGRHDFPSSNGDQLFSTIKQHLYALPDDTLALPGHGPHTAIGDEKANNPFVRGD